MEGGFNIKVRYTIYNENCLPVYDIIIPRVDNVFYEKHCISLYKDDGTREDFPLTVMDFTLEVIR